MKHLLALILVVVFATFTIADDAASGKKDKSPKQIAKLKKMLKPVTLTAEQETSFAEALKTYTTKIKELEGNGLTAEKLKARTEKRKEARESGLSGEEMQAFINEGVSEEELKMFSSFEKSNRAVEKTVAKMLTEEQMGALPEKVQKRLAKLAKTGKGKKGGKGKGKKKKAADAE